MNMYAIMYEYNLHVCMYVRKVSANLHRFGSPPLCNRVQSFTLLLHVASTT